MSYWDPSLVRIARLETTFRGKSLESIELFFCSLLCGIQIPALMPMKQCQKIGSFLTHSASFIGIRYEHVPFHTGLLGHACQTETYGGSVAGAKVSVNDFETVRPVIDHLLWFHSGEQSDVRPSVLPKVCFFPGDR
jgi:hypothetical protein